MGSQPDAQSMASVAIEAIREQDAGLMPIVGVRPVELGQAKEGTGLQQRRGSHQIVASV